MSPGTERPGAFAVTTNSVSRISNESTDCHRGYEGKYEEAVRQIVNASKLMAKSLVLGEDSCQPKD